VSGALELGRPLNDAIGLALQRNARAMLEPAPGLAAGIPAMRALAAGFHEWSDIDDWSWAARFGYQVVIKRGAGGKFFRSLYADFLREAAVSVPELGEALPAARMDAIADRWCELAAVLKDQSEREVCEPELFQRAGRIAGDLADVEEAFFSDALRVAERLDSGAAAQPAAG